MEEIKLTCGVNDIVKADDIEEVEAKVMDAAKEMKKSAESFDGLSDTLRVAKVQARAYIEKRDCAKKLMQELSRMM